MKKFAKTLICIALLLSLACAVKEYYFPQETAFSAISADDQYAHLHKPVNNAEQQWNLILINRWNKSPINLKVSLYETENGEKVDERIYPYLEEMFNAANKDGYEPEIASGYRTRKKQKQLFDEKMNEYLEQGYSRKNAKKMTLKWVALPGYSEHHTGLAVDINSENGYSGELYKWLEENSYKYGFILRYPATATEITETEYEPWHFRFVGEEAAEYIYKNGITFEEYILL